MHWVYTGIPHCATSIIILILHTDRVKIVGQNQSPTVGRTRGQCCGARRSRGFIYHGNSIRPAKYSTSGIILHAHNIIYSHIETALLLLLYTLIILHFRSVEELGLYVCVSSISLSRSPSLHLSRSTYFLHRLFLQFFLFSQIILFTHTRLRLIRHTYLQDTRDLLSPR